MATTNPRIARVRRHVRVREKINGTAVSPRLAVFRSLNNIYAQVIDDTKGNTIVAASTLDEEIKKASDGKNKSDVSVLVGQLLAKRALAAGVTQVAFDRGGFKYHGRVKALADGAREAGLRF
jgi:large subunit ribosomal protein L18